MYGGICKKEAAYDTGDYNSASPMDENMWYCSKAAGEDCGQTELYSWRIIVSECNIRQWLFGPATFATADRATIPMVFSHDIHICYISLFLFPFWSLIVMSNRVWVQIDTLFISETLTEALEISKAGISAFCLTHFRSVTGLIFKYSAASSRLI